MYQETPQILRLKVEYTVSLFQDPNLIFISARSKICRKEAHLSCSDRQHSQVPCLQVLTLLVGGVPRIYLQMGLEDRTEDR
jgi:hypothetical protein